MLHERNEAEKANLLGERLVGGATEAALLIVEELETRFGLGLRNGSEQQFATEVVVFYMHIVDRLAFRHLGPKRRQVFGDCFVLKVIEEFLRIPEKGIDPAAFASQLKDTYNRRQIEYARYGELIPAKEDPPKDTLFWEFNKILFAFINDTNPVTLLFLNLFVVDISLELLKVIKVEEVLQG
jgi:hypothetical protein